MKELLETLRAWTSEPVAVGRAVNVRTFGSTPWREGATLLRAADGRIAGSVSGGCVEGAAAEEIERAIGTGLQRVVRYGITDQEAWDVGLACGGTIDVLIQPFVPEQIVRTAGRSADDAGAAVVTVLPDDAPPATPGAHRPGTGASPLPPLIVNGDGSLEGSLGGADADAALVAVAREALERAESRIVQVAGRQLFVEAFPVPPRLVIIGAVQVALSLVRFARELGWATVVVDGRPAFATRERFPDVDRLIVGWPDDAADEIGLGPNDAVAVLTHDAKFDEPAIIEALRRECRYVGAIGSRKTQADRRARLAGAGVSTDEIERLRGPIGLDLGGRAPAETAVAIVGEIIAARHGATGRPMREVARERGMAPRAAEEPADGGDGRPAEPARLGRAEAARKDPIPAR